MDLQHEAVVRFLDLAGAGAGLETQYGQGLVRCHRGAGRRPARPVGAGATSRRLAPVRHEAIEVAFDQANRGRIFRAHLAPERDERVVVELLQAPALEAALAHGTGHRAGLMIEAHAEIVGLDLGDLALRPAAAARPAPPDGPHPREERRRAAERHHQRQETSVLDQQHRQCERGQDSEPHQEANDDRGRQRHEGPGRREQRHQENDAADQIERHQAPPIWRVICKVAPPVLRV